MTSVPSMITVPTKTTVLTVPIMVMTISTMIMLTSAHGAQNDHRTDSYNNTYGAHDDDSAQSVLYDQNAHSVHRTLGLKSYSPFLQTHYHILSYPKNKTSTKHNTYNDYGDHSYHNHHEPMPLAKKWGRPPSDLDDHGVHNGRLVCP